MTTSAGPMAAARYLVRGARLVGGFLRGGPVHCIVQVSNRCNLTCGFCSFWENAAPREDEMTLEDFEVISAKLAEGGSMVVSIEGGEPLLRNDIVGIVTAFARYHHPILFTNGWKVTVPLARDLWNAGLSQIGVSIDYAVPADHDRHRGLEGTFDAAMRALDVLRDTAPQGRRQVNVMTVVMDDNAGQLEALLKLSEGKGVNHQATLISTGGDGRHARAQKPPPPGIGRELVALKERYPHFTALSGYLEGIDPFLEDRPRTTCHAGRRFLNIDHLGDVSPCIEKLHLRAGNLRRDPWSVVYGNLCALEETKRCTDCFTSCRGFVDEMTPPLAPRAWSQFFGDFANQSTSRPNAPRHSNRR